MIKNTVLFFSLLTSIFAHSIEVTFIGPCSSEPMLTTQSAWYNEGSVGSYTIELLERFEVEYLGNEQGLASAFGTPVGDEALEIISDIEMRAYGWCYEVSGVSPEVYPNLYFPNENETITWFYGFARFLAGEWVSQCEPVHKIKPKFLCNN